MDLNIVVYSLYLLFFLYTLFFRINRNAFLLITIFFFAFVAYKVVSFSFLNNLLYLFLVGIIFIYFLLFLFLGRIYPYILAIIFIVFMPILLALKLEEVSNLFGAVAFILLVTGLIRDIFYEKFFG